jgi:hypothetical protein
MNANLIYDEDDAPEETQETDEYPWETDTSSGDTGKDDEGTEDEQ